MAFNLSNYLPYIRFLVGEPLGYSVSDGDILGFYLNPTYQEWYYRFERRPGNFTSNFLLAGSTDAFAIDNTGAIIEHATAIVGGVEGGLKQSEYNRLRYLIETEGAVGPPDQWGQIKFEDGYTYCIFYPIPDDNYDVNFYIQAGWSEVTNNPLSTMGLIDVISQHMVCRLTAYRMAVDLGRPERRIRAILMPVAPWIRMHFNMQYLLEDKAIDKERSSGYTQERTIA